MSRPDFPRPYCVLPANCIRRIVENQNHYDENPERAEQEQRAAEERRMLELQQEQEEEARYWESQKEEDIRIENG